MRLEAKQQITEDLHERFAKSAIIVLTDYKGLDVASINDLRRKLRESNVEYQVVKKFASCAGVGRYRGRFDQRSF